MSKSTRSKVFWTTAIGWYDVYPVTKCTPSRAADMIEMYGPERLMANSAGDWGQETICDSDLIMELRKTRTLQSVDQASGFRESQEVLFTVEGL